jgi:hypothetical protein
MDTRLGRLDWVELVVDRSRWTGEVIDFVHLYIERKGNVVPDHFEMRVGNKVTNIVASPGKEIVHAQHVMARGDKPVTEVRPEESGPARDQYALSETVASYLQGISRPAGATTPARTISCDIC